VAACRSRPWSRPTGDIAAAAAADPRRRAEVAASGVSLDGIRREYHELDVYEPGLTPGAASIGATASPTSHADSSRTSG
jgi:hypothetical protein